MSVRSLGLATVAVVAVASAWAGHPARLASAASGSRSALSSDGRGASRVLRGSAQDAQLFLDNGTVRVGVDLDAGGAISFVSPSGGDAADNLVNVHDLGRFVQQSYYSGPDNLGVPCPNNFGGWNPISAGDCYGNPSTVLESSDDGETIYVRSRPLQWAFDDVPCECTFEQWITLDGDAILVRNKLTNARSDHTLYPAMGQELPAMYTIGRLSRLVTYSGSRPWTNGPLTEVSATLPNPVPFLASEHWAASVGPDGSGLGIFKPDVSTFAGGFFGTRGSGGPLDDPTGYISPSRQEILDWDIVYQFSYALVLGTVTEIRAYAVSHRPPLPDWTFSDSRDGFTEENASDQGAPITNELRLTLDRDDPQLVSPPTFWRARHAPAVLIRMALHGTDATEAQLFWASGTGGFDAQRQVRFAVSPDGAFHTYRISLIGLPGYTNALTRLRLDPVDTGAPGVSAEIDEIALLSPKQLRHSRAVTFGIGEGGGRGRVTVRDGFAACVGDVRVLLQRRSSRTWRRVRSATTNADGSYDIPVRGRGEFRTVLPTERRGPDDCLSASSRVRRR